MTVEWHNKIVNISQTDMLQVQTAPVEIYQLDLYDFHKELHTLQESPDGIVFDDIHDHISPKTVSGVILARVVEIINNYTVTFEDGLYNVNIVGGNSNISDRTNKNQVGVNTANSAGLQDLSSLQASSFAEGAVTIRQSDGTFGTTYPIGTKGKPSNNWEDSVAIANKGNMDTVTILGMNTLTTGDDVTSIKIKGTNPMTSILVVEAGSVTDNVYIQGLYFTGALDGGAILRECVLGDIHYFNGFIDSCVFAGDNIFTYGDATFINCVEGAKVLGTSTIDMTNGDNLFIRNYQGDIQIANKTTTGLIEIQADGRVTIDATCTNGNFRIYGDCQVVNNSSLTIDDQTTGTPDEIASLVNTNVSALTVEQNEQLMKTATKNDVIVGAML